jgi:anti-sigma factor ChrR (cupin superfamily)
MADESTKPGIDADLAGVLGTALSAPALPAGLRERLRTRVLERAAGIHVVRANAGVWTKVLPGISVKQLRVDAQQGTETNLWRLRAGATIPAHQHHDEEECLVLEGSIIQDGIEYGVGDYLLAGAGSHHVPLTAPHGALLLIRSQRLHSYLAPG